MSASAAPPRFSSYTMVLPVFDEEARVERVIRYYRRFASVIAVDNFSTDRTAELARACGARVVQYRNPGTVQTPEWHRFVAGLIDTDHFLVLSCSEFIPATLLERFDEIARTRTADVVSCGREIYTAGERLTMLFGRQPQWVERFYDRNGLDYDAIEIHGNFSPLDPARLLRLPREERYLITHVRDADAVSLMEKITRYAAVEAVHRAERGKPLTIGLLLRVAANELYQLARLGPRGWTRVAAREIWIRLVMHSIIHWVGWELKEGRTLEDSRRRSEQLWRRLVDDQRG